MKHGCAGERDSDSDRPGFGRVLRAISSPEVCGIVRFASAAVPSCASFRIAMASGMRIWRNAEGMYPKDILLSKVQNMGEIIYISLRRAGIGLPGASASGAERH